MNETEETNHQLLDADARQNTHLAVWVTVVVALFGVLVYASPLFPIWGTFMEDNPFVKDATQAVGALLFGVGASNVFTAAYTQSSLERHFSIQARDIFHGELESHASAVTDQLAAFKEQLDRQLRLGAAGLVDMRSEAGIKHLLEHLRAEDTLWCLDTYSKSFEAWAAPLEEALKKGATAYVLALDPSSSVARMRGLEIGPTVDEFLEAANGYCRQLTELRGRYHRLHVAKYDNLPCAPMYIIERQGRFERAHSSYFLSKSTDYFPHFEWKAPSEFGEDMLKYVKQKWKSYEAEDQPANSTARPPEYGHPALGCWLYTLEFNAHPETKVYGKFFIHKDDEVLRAEGEAFYFGKPPDRAQRRGMWRSRSVEMLEGRRGMNIMYDMLIQSGPLGAPGAHYVGEMKFRDTDFHNRVVSGEFFARGVEHRGNVWVRRLPHLAQRIPPDVSFQEHLWEAFHTYFDGVEICPKELLRHKSTARDSVSSPIASSRS